VADITAEREAEEAKRREEVDDAYRAIGYYFVAFSQLVFRMRFLMSRRLTKQHDKQELGELAFGTAMAQQIADSFFSMCRFERRHLQWPRVRRLEWPHLASVVCVGDVA
jgi:hypothetical protein